MLTRAAPPPARSTWARCSISRATRLERSAAYERAERRGDPDAAFNLGVLLYEAGDLDGAEAAWRRSAGRGHARAAENLEFLLRHRQELETAGVAGEEGEDR